MLQVLGRVTQSHWVYKQTIVLKMPLKYYKFVSDKGYKSTSTPMLKARDKYVIHSLVIVKVNETHFWVLRDTWTGSSYTFATLIDKTNKKPSKMELRNNEMMKHATIISFGVYQVEVSDVSGNH